MKHLLARALLSLVLGAYGIALGADWGPLSREEALTALTSKFTLEKRKGLGRLAEIGEGQDVPKMLKLLWDDDVMVRGMASQAVWGLWMRANDPQVDPLFQQAVELITHDNIDQAVVTLNKVILAKPRFAEAWNKMGDVYSHLGDYDAALRNYMQALEFNPYHFGVMESCGFIWLQRQKLKRAASWFKKALEINPNLVSAGLTLRRIEEELGSDNI